MKRRTEAGEEWKWKEALEAGKYLYEQWREVFQLVMAFVDTLPETPESAMPDTREMIYENVYIVAPKLLAAAGDTLYEIKMENAAIIRYNCRQLMEQVGFAVLSGKTDDLYQEAIEEAMDEFKHRFRHWVSFFKRDEFEDEWGLFV